MSEFLSYLVGAVLILLSLSATATAGKQPTSTKDSAAVVDWNTLLDGSLGKLPAVWLVSQGVLLEVKRLEGKKNKRDPAVTVRTPDSSTATLC